MAPSPTDDQPEPQSSCAQVRGLHASGHNSRHAVDADIKRFAMNKHWDQPMPQADASALTEHESGTASAAATRAAVDELQFRELFRMLRRRSRFILITALCGALIVLGLGVLIPPKYTAKAQLVIDQGTTEAAALSKDET